MLLTIILNGDIIAVQIVCKYVVLSFRAYSVGDLAKFDGFPTEIQRNTSHEKGVGKNGENLC